MAQAVYDEQHCIILAFDAEELVSNNELKLFHPGAAEHVKGLLEIVDTVLADLEHNILGYMQTL
ncbi:hypothetical protein EDC04DRAFT_2900800 [Pisolithus marmoratus]|nr:hypothetical protein EDC04DRAFT_2900800 [Pisolithus marmoratus]